MYDHNFSAKLSEGLELIKAKPFAAQGRLTRDEFFKFMLVLGLALMVIGVIPVVGWIAMIAGYIIIILAMIRRLHDVGLSGWWCLVPIYNTFLLVQDSDGDNQWGDAPRLTVGEHVDTALKAAHKEIDELVGKASDSAQAAKEEFMDVLDNADNDDLNDFDDRLKH